MVTPSQGIAKKVIPFSTGTTSPKSNPAFFITHLKPADKSTRGSPVKGKFAGLISLKYQDENILGNNVPDKLIPVIHHHPGEGGGIRPGLYQYKTGKRHNNV